MADKLRYDVEVNTRDGVRELDRLGKAGKEAGEDIEEGFDGSESAAKSAATALVQAARDIEQALKSDKEAADALALALGPELAAKIDTGAVVTELKTLGLTADQVKADADTMALALKEIDDIKMSAVKSELTTVDNSIRNVGEQGDNSRSVMANLAGNTTQTMFGNLGGTIGDVGMALGQLAEYSAEGNISMGGLAKMAGPMLGLSAALALVSSAQAKIAAEEAFHTEQVDAYKAAIDELGPSLEAVEQRLGTLGEIAPEETAGSLEKIATLVGQVGEEAATALTPWESLGGSISNLPAVLADLGFNYEYIAQVIAGGTPALEAFEETLKGIPEAEGLTGPVIDALTAQQEGYADALGVTTDQLADQTGRQKTLADQAAFYATSIEGINQALQDQNDELVHSGELWDVVLTDLADGAINTDAAAVAWSKLQAELELGNVEMAELAEQKLDEKLQADADAAVELADKVIEVAEALNAAKDNVAEFDRVVGSAEWGDAAVVGATTAYEEFREAVTGDRQRVAASEEAWDGLADSIGTAGDSLLDMQTPEGRAVFDALDELGTSIVPDLAQAFADSDGDIDKFRQSTDRLARQTLTRLQDEFGISQEDAADMIAELGLMPEQVETFYRLAGDEEAKVKLGLLQGVLDNLPTEVQSEVAMHILADDPQAALDVIETAIAGGVTTPMHANTAPAWEDYRNFKRAVEQATIVARIVASGFFGGGGGSGGARSVSTAPSAAAVTELAPVNVYVNAPRGTRGDDLVRAGDRYARRNGRARAHR